MKKEDFIVDYLHKGNEPTFIMQIKINIFQEWYTFDRNVS